MKVVHTSSRALALTGASPGAYGVLDVCGPTVFDPLGVSAPWG